MLSAFLVPAGKVVNNKNKYLVRYARINVTNLFRSLAMGLDVDIRVSRLLP